MDRKFLHSTGVLICEFPWHTFCRNGLAKFNWDQVAYLHTPLIHGFDLTHKHLQEHLVLQQAGACMTAEKSDGAYSVQTLHLLPEPVLYPPMRTTMTCGHYSHAAHTLIHH